MEGANHTTVAVVDDHRTFCELLVHALETTVGVACVGSAATPDEAVTLVRRERPDVVLVDIQLGRENGLRAVNVLTREYPDLKAIVLTALADQPLVSAAFKAGACGVLTKSATLGQLLNAVRTLPRDGFYLDPALTMQLVTLPDEPLASAALTKRELEVLQLLAEGMTVQRIAQRLSLAVSTCRGYVKSILAKLNAHTQLEAVSIGLRDGIISTPRSTR